MSERGVPLLALVLASAATSHLRLDTGAQAHLRDDFTAAVAELDKADRAYRAAIEATLAPAAARTMLSTMAEFRERAHQVRESATQEMREIYRRNNRDWDWIDPLDAHAAPPRGLSHADATRISGIGDRARTQVDSLRAQANAHVAPLLDGERMQALRAFRLERYESFARVLREALQRGLDAGAAITPQELDKAAEYLTQLADGWY